MLAVQIKRLMSQALAVVLALRREFATKLDSGAALAKLTSHQSNLT